MKINTNGVEHANSSRGKKWRIEIISLYTAMQSLYEKDKRFALLSNTLLLRMDQRLRTGVLLMKNNTHKQQS